MSDNAYKGFYFPLKAKVTRIDDPEQLNRVQVYIPSYHGEFDEALSGYSDELGEYPWAQISTVLFKDGNNYTIDSMKELFAGEMPIILPSVGTIGWVMFEGGDIRAPIYIGSLSKGAVNETVEGAYTGSDANNMMTTSGASNLTVMANIIFANESGGKNYNIINPLDVDAISIGLLQWHADNGRELMRRIKDANQLQYMALYASNGANFSIDKSWKGFYVSKGDNNYNAIKAIIDTPTGHTMQDEYTNEYLSNYVAQGETVGVTDFKAQIYFCDMYNQSPNGAMNIAKATKDKSLDGLYRETMNGNYWLGSTAYNNRDRRTRVYNEVKMLDVASALNSATSTDLQGAPSLGFAVEYPTDCKEIVETFERGVTKGIKIFEEGIAGSEVRASHSGVARFLDRGSKGNGKFVEITSGKYVTRYTHLQSFAQEHRNHAPSDLVEIEQGEVIGFVGRSGDANSVFLGFELLMNGVAVDPLPYLEGVSNNYNASSNGVIETAVNFMLDVANDSSHGYSQQNRWGNPDYDCSSLIVTAYQMAGTGVKDHGATYTGNMRSAFTQCGFTAIPFSANMELIRGDVLLNEVHHTACYIGNNQIVHASTAGGHPEGGDQTSKEICVRDMYIYGTGGWDYVLRYTGGN